MSEMDKELIALSNAVADLCMASKRVADALEHFAEKGGKEDAKED